MKNRIEEVQNRIIKSLTDGSVAIKCGFCDGIGSAPETPFDEIPPSDPCVVCSGRGMNVFREDIGNLMICALCSGDGKAIQEGHFVGDICPTCKGKGIITICESSDGYQEDAFWLYLHPRIIKVSKSRFEASHYADSVEAAFKEINVVGKRLLRRKTKEDRDGANIFEELLSLNRPLIKLGDLNTESGKNVQKGYLQLFCGAFIGIRNPKAHENISITKNNAIHLLFLASLLMEKLIDY